MSPSRHSRVPDHERADRRNCWRLGSIAARTCTRLAVRRQSTATTMGIACVGSPRHETCDLPSAMREHTRGLMNSLRLSALVVALVAAAPGPALAQDDADAFRTRRMPYEAFDRLQATRVMIGNTAFDVAFAPGALALPQTVIVDWIAASGRTVAAYYGRFPVDHLRVLVVPANGTAVRTGTAFANRGSAVRIVLGRTVTAQQLADDWIIVHELVHLAFPSVATEHHWIEEGLATYVESISRAQAGRLRADQVWGNFVRRMPQGLPAANDQGLDHTPTWGRTYWGGAMFCLLADVQIRERTHNRFGLQDALRAIVAAEVNMESYWPLERALRIADAAIEAPALEGLYDQMKATPVSVDLPQLWQRLGIELRGDSVFFDDSAPLAPARRAITAARG